MANAKNMSSTTLKVLLYGPSGTGKTTLCSSFPNPHFVDADNGMLSVSGKDLTYITVSNKETTDPDFLEICKLRKKDLTRFPKSEAFTKATFLIEHWANTLTEEDTLIVDSLTFMNDWAMSYVCKLAGVPQPRIQDWGAAQKMLENIFEQVNDVKCNLVIIAHEQFVKDEDSGVISWLPLTIGKLATKIPIYFDEVWRTYTERSKSGDSKGEQVYGIETRPTRRTTAKSRLQLPEKVETPTYQKILSLRNSR